MLLRGGTLFFAIQFLTRAGNFLTHFALAGRKITPKKWHFNQMFTNIV